MQPLCKLLCCGNTTVIGWVQHACKLVYTKHIGWDENPVIHYRSVFFIYNLFCVVLKNLCIASSIFFLINGYTCIENDLLVSLCVSEQRTDPQLLAQFYYADEELNQVATELDGLDGRKDPQRCTLLVNQFRSCQVSREKPTKSSSFCDLHFTKDNAQSLSIRVIISSIHHK